MKPLETMFIKHCSPTLAGLKTASLFRYNAAHKEHVLQEITEWNRLLKSKGVAVLSLAEKNNQYLIYVYRPKNLAKDLSKKETRVYLTSLGYEKFSERQYLLKLSERIKTSPSFPHEIGLFLGYPFHDVKGFIDNGGKNCEFCGCWKVYCHQYQMKKLFSQFKKCTQIYATCFQNGKSVEELTVAV